MNQPQKTPLTELLRAIPPAQRAEWAFQWGESGRPTGHVMCPFGKLAHEAADEIERLQARVAGLEAIENCLPEIKRVLRQHRYCGDQYPDSGWPDVVALIAKIQKLGEKTP
jgi:hypothetical protein